MRLSNSKTRSETGLDHVMQSINVLTPFGKRRLEELTPFEPGQEDKLNNEFRKVEEVLWFVDKKPELYRSLTETLMDIKDISFTIKRSSNNVLSVVELFEVKSLLLKMHSIIELLGMRTLLLPKEFILEDISELLDILDPRKDRMSAFYIYDDFSEKLKEFRNMKRNQERLISNEKKAIKSRIESLYGIKLTSRFEYSVSKSDKELLRKIKELTDLKQCDEDYLSITFTIKETEKIDLAKHELDRINEHIDEQELLIRERLSKSIGRFSHILLENCNKIGELDFVLAKAIYVKQNHCVRPYLVKEHRIEIVDGRYLPLEEILNKKSRHYCPVSIQLENGVTCITGANMGGKTISLKLVGQVAMLTQYGFYVPCKEAKIGLSNYIHILIGDNQSVRRGLSSFGSEMEELKEVLDNSKERSLLLIDEIASGTNPVEGLAFTKSIIEYFNTRSYICLITTHYDGVAEGEGIKNLQVIGLANADFQKLEKELRYENRSERIEIISKYMDYRLYHAKNDEEIPKEALNIARILGIYDEIIENAKKYMSGKKGNA
ncbi:MAG: MutS-related protein [Anaerovoracaceae bacterium]